MFVQRLACKKGNYQKTKYKNDILDPGIDFFMNFPFSCLKMQCLGIKCVCWKHEKSLDTYDSHQFQMACLDRTNACIDESHF